MKGRIKRTLVTGAAVAAAAVVAAVPASAAQATITVTNPNADGHFAAATPTTGDPNVDNVVLTNTRTGVGFYCAPNGSAPASSATGTIPTGTYTVPPPQDVGDIDSLIFNNCTGPLGPVTATATSLPYDFMITSYDPSAGNAGRAYGYITGVDVDVSMPDCAFTVIGSAPGYYDNATHSLVMTPGVSLPDSVTPLTMIDVVGCQLGGVQLVAEGDTGTYEGTYVVTDPINPSITVS